MAVDIGLIMNEISFYRSQLGLPEEGSAEFAKLNVINQEKVRKICLTTTAQVSGFLALCATEAAVGGIQPFHPLSRFGHSRWNVVCYHVLWSYTLSGKGRTVGIVGPERSCPKINRQFGNRLIKVGIFY